MRLDLETFRLSDDDERDMRDAITSALRQWKGEGVSVVHKGQYDLLRAHAARAIGCQLVSLREVERAWIDMQIDASMEREGIS